MKKIASISLLALSSLALSACGGSTKPPVFQNGVTAFAQSEQAPFEGCIFDAMDMTDYTYDLWVDCKVVDFAHKAFPAAADHAVMVAEAHTENEGATENETRATVADDEITVGGVTAKRTITTYSADPGPNNTVTVVTAGNHVYTCVLSHWTPPSADYRLKTDDEVAAEQAVCDAGIESMMKVIAGK